MFNSILISAALIGLHCPVTTYNGASCEGRTGADCRPRFIQLVVDVGDKSGDLWMNGTIFYSNDVRVTPNAIAFPYPGYRGRTSWVIIDRNNLSFQVDRAGGVCQLRTPVINRQF
jgi:hypothetical protein